MRLAELLAEVAAGRFPPPDGEVTVLPQPSARDAGVLSFTAHTVVFTDEDPAWVRAQIPAGDLSAPLLPQFLQAICLRTGRRVNNIDLLCVTTPLAGPPPLRLIPLAETVGSGAAAGRSQPAGAALPTQTVMAAPPATPAPVRPPTHPRLARALRYRDEIRAWTTPGGILLLGRGVAGRWEIAVEVDPGCRGQGLGRELATAGRHLMPEGAPLWAQIAPGNAASVRTFLAAGYQPVGAEALLPLVTP